MTPTVPEPADPILDPLARHRPAVGYALAALAVLFLAGGGYCFVKAFSDPPAAEKPAEDGLAPASKIETDEPAGKLARPYASEYTLGGILGVLCALAMGAAGGWLLGRPPTAVGPADRRADRLLVFAVAASLGAAFMILGAVLFYLWFGDLTKWLGAGEKAEPLKPLLAVLAFLLGAGALFAGVQPLRAEERSDVLLRRTVYGTNFFLTALLLLVALVFVNVLASLKLPAVLDTTETGFFTLAPTTGDYLGRLDREVTIHTMIPETREGIDILRVLHAFRDANPKMVKVKELSLTLDKNEIANLKAKFPTADLADATGRGNYGLIVALGPDEKRYQFLLYDELHGRETAQRGQPPGRRLLQAEPRIIREILFLTENKRKPVIYFTQGAGEISVEATGGPDAKNARPGEQVKGVLIADYCDVKPLRFEALAVDPKVPDDATAVIVADPTARLSESATGAIGRYMAAPRPDGTKGKLLVMAGAHRDPANPSGLLSIGLEKLLAEYGIGLRDRVLYAEPSPEGLPPFALIAGVPRSLLAAKNTIALTFADKGFVLTDLRPLALEAAAGRGPAKPLLITGEDRVMWVEPTVAANPIQAFETLKGQFRAGRRDLTDPKEVSQKSRVIAALASDSEPEVGRVVAFGYGGFEDGDPGAGGRGFPAELVGASVNWLRDRPAVANEGAKPYGVYTPNPKFDWTRGFTLPVVLVILSISAVGLGLGVLRRR